MALYEYACPAGHHTDAHFDMGTAPDAVDCICGDRARRIFSAPNTSLMGYRAKINRRRRKNPGDDLPIGFDDEAAAIAAQI